VRASGGALTAEDLAAAIARAAGKDDELRAIVRACIKSMREGKSADRLMLAETLMPLAAHANARVRQEIAEGCDLFPEPFYTQAYVRLAKDDDHFVCTAAERARKRHLASAKAKKKSDEHDRTLAELLAEIEKQWKKGGRKKVELAMRMAVEQLVVRYEHELSRPRRAYDIAWTALMTEIERPAPAPGTLRERAAAVRECDEYQQKIFQRMRMFAVRQRGTFVDEGVWEVVDQARRQVLAVFAGGRPVEVEVDVEHQLRAEVDRHALIQALENVTKNGLEAYEEGVGVARVRIVARRVMEEGKGAEVEITVTDQGKGMNAERLAELFTPFSSTKAGGTGVGMVTARKMIDDVHDGELTVKSAPGEGTTVTMRIPAKREGR